MLFVAIASAVLVTVLGAERNPTEVCLPERFQTFIFAFQNDVTGIAAFDFPNEVVSIRTTNGYRTVYNLTDYSAIFVNETSGQCSELPRNPRYETIGTRCLPANAVRVGNVTTFVGSGASRTEFEAYEFQFPGVGSITAAVTTTNPALPILRQYLSEDGTEREVIFFFNAQDGITEEDIFDIPDNCTPRSVLG